MTVVVAFWAASLTVLYTYVGYPALVLGRAALCARPTRSGALQDVSVSVIIAAHNEEAVIAERLENLLRLDWPAERLEIIIASDGSEDRTEEIVAGFGSDAVHLLALPRVGKAAALNAAVERSTGKLLVFSDANSMYAADALRALSRPFADPSVGGVAGDQRYLKDDAGGAVAHGERCYWDIDRVLKRAQSRAGSVISATGAIYALRRELYEPIPPGVTDDFFASTAAVRRGRRLVFEPAAVAYERVSATADVEFGRKVRVISQGLRSVIARRSLLDPSAHGFYAVQLLSHKVLRRLMVVPLAVLAVSAPVLWGRGPLYQVVAVGQGVLYGGALLGAITSAVGQRPPRVLRLPMYFTMVNAACVVAVWNLVRGRRIERWEPQRDDAASPPPMNDFANGTAGG